jgi:hypothetical protein
MIAAKLVVVIAFIMNSRVASRFIEETESSKDFCSELKVARA